MGSERNPQSQDDAPENTIRMQRQWLNLHTVMLSAIDAHLVLIDDACRIAFINDSCLKDFHALGLPPGADPTGYKFASVISGLSALKKSDQQGILTYVDGLFSGDEDLSQLDFSCNSGGQEQWFNLRGQLVDEDQFRGVLIIGLDVTDRVRNELQVRRDLSEIGRIDDERLRLAHAVEQAADSVVIISAAGITEYVNSAFEHTYGLRRADVLAAPANFLGETERGCSPFSPPWFTHTGGVTWAGRLLVDTKTAGRKTLDTTIKPMLDGSGAVRHYVATLKDVTLQLVMEQRLHQAKTMESIGQLAGGVAHDFNNLLTVIKGHTEHLLEHLDSSSNLRADIKVINQAVDSAAKLTNDLLSIGRRQILLTDVVNLHHAIQGKRTLLRTLLGARITLHLDLMPGPAPVKVDPGRIEQVIINLTVNARDAMPEGGQLTLRTFSSTVNSSGGAHSDLATGTYVALQAVDTGCGIEADVISRIFEPFFTTKAAGEGTGLGLSSAYGIVRQSGGSIVAESVPGQGATFTVYLPAASASPVSEETPLRECTKARRSERILLVEDSPEIRRMTLRALSRIGYEVEVAESAEEALEIIEQTARQFDLLITDVVLPGLSGPDLVARIEAGGRSLRVIFISGYAHDHKNLLRAKDAGKMFLQKPFSLADLSEVTAAVLADEAPALARSGAWLHTGLRTL